MVIDRNWGLIRYGETFAGLVSTIVFSCDPEAILFGRPGKDGAQDVLSGDRATAYQAKLIGNGSAATAISKAKSELKKIKKYRAKGHSRYEQWKNVTTWIMMTSAEFNPKEESRWENEVVPKFKQIGLRALLRHREYINYFLIKNPDIDRAFFSNEPRVLLTLPEARSRFERSSPFLPRATQVAMRGRDESLKTFKAFLASDKSYIVVNGSGGIGKTKFIIEAGAEVATEPGWQVLWANIESMLNGQWYLSIIPERPTLLIVDEPDDESLIKKLNEHVGVLSGRASKWKVAITVRSPKDPVLKFLSDPSMKRHCESLPLDEIDTSSAEQFCKDLIRESKDLSEMNKDVVDNASKEIAKRFNKYPVWIALAVDLLERTKSLSNIPQDSAALAEKYLDEIYTKDAIYSENEIKDVLCWTALLKSVNRQDEIVRNRIIDATCIDSHEKLQKLFERLVGRRVLVKRGAYDRIVEIKPDVIRDHILQEWLVYNDGCGPTPWKPTEKAASLVNSLVDILKNGEFSEVDIPVLVSIAIIEWKLNASRDDINISLLDSFFESLQTSIASMDAAALKDALSAITHIAQIRPMDVVELSKVIRETPCKVTVYYPDSRYEFAIYHEDVILELAWVVMYAAMGARESSQRIKVLEELCELVIAEHKIGEQRERGLPPDGKRAGQLLSRVLEGGPSFWAPFDNEVLEVGLKILQNTKGKKEIPSGRIQAFTALLTQATAVEREFTYSRDERIYFNRYIVGPGDPRWEIRDKILERLWQMIEEDEVTDDVAVAFWNIISSAHSSALSGLSFEEKESQQVLLREDMLNDLQRALRIISYRVENSSMSWWQFKAARELWQWHYKYDDDEEMKEIASSLEQVYLDSDVVKEFDVLLFDEKWDLRNKYAEDKAKVLSGASDLSPIKDYTRKADQFLSSGDQQGLSQIYIVAIFLGQKEYGSEVVQDYVRKSLQLDSADRDFKFATWIVSARLKSMRESDSHETVIKVVEDLTELCKDDLTKSMLLIEAYSVHPKEMKFVSGLEIEYVRSTMDMFVSTNNIPAFISIIGRGFFHDWDVFKKAAEGALKWTIEDKLILSTNNLINSIHNIISLSEIEEGLLPSDTGMWLLDRILELPDIDKLSDRSHRDLVRILQKEKKPDVSWLLKAIRQRMDMVKNTSENTDVIRPFPAMRSISSYVEPLKVEDSTTPTIRKCVQEIIDCSIGDFYVHSVLPQYLVDLDPSGCVVPELIAETIQSESLDIYDLTGLSGVAGSYQMNSDAWTTIAKAVCAISDNFSQSDKYSLFSSLLEANRVISGIPGQAAPHFTIERDNAAKDLKEEKDPGLLPFRKWRLEVTEEELHYQEEMAREARGE